LEPEVVEVEVDLLLLTLDIGDQVELEAAEEEFPAQSILLVYLLLPA
jgi:hypothetical protein